jgi:hypothetical protein
MYLQPIDEPMLKGRTNGDLALWAVQLREAFSLAETGKAKARDILFGNDSVRDE